MHQFVEWKRPLAKCKPGTGQTEPLRLDWAQRQWLATTHECHLQSAHCPAALGVTDASVFSRADGGEHSGSPWGYRHVPLLARSMSKQRSVPGVCLVIGVHILLIIELQYGFHT